MTYKRSVALAVPRTKGRKAPTASGAVPNYVRLSTKAGKGLELSIDWAMGILEDPEAKDWAKAQAMTFFAKLQHLIIPAEGPTGETPIDRFMKLMAEIRTVPKIVDEPPLGPTVTEEDDDELEEDESALFEAAPS